MIKINDNLPVVDSKMNKGVREKTELVQIQE
jgi:hypothetical protein